MPSTIDFTGLERLKKRVEAMGAVDYTPLMQEWADILQEDNARGLLAGEDASGAPMPATQRERSEGRSRREGSGPPLVPKSRNSRAIKNARSQGFRLTESRYEARLWWEDFEAASNGRFILGMHAAPTAGARYPRRDVIGHPRPEALRRCRAALKAFLEARLKP